MRRKRCYIYTRVSTAVQTEGYSLEAQQERLRQYAKYKELEIVGEYCDAGKSGKSIKGRPAFQQMMEDVASQKDDVSYVLVFKLSRFGRNAADVLKSLQLLLDYEVDLVAVDDAIDSSTQGGRLTLTILSAVAEIERENITVQFMAGRIQKIKGGAWTGGPIPYGYRNSKAGLVQEPSEAEIVRKIYDLYLQDGILATTVARYLNDHGYSRTVKDKQKPFTYYGVTTILDNPVYCGRILYNRRTNSKDPKRQKREIIEVEGKHEPIVSKEKWEQVHQKRQQYSERCKKVDEPDRISLLSGLVKCPMCGYGMVASKNKQKNKNHGGYYKILHYYSCGNAQKQRGMTCSFRHTYNQEKVDGAVLEMVSKLTMIPSFEKKLTEHFVIKNSIDELTELLRKSRKDLYHQEQQRRKLGEILDNLDVFSDDYSENYDRIQEETDLVYDRIDELETSIEKTKKKLDSAKQGVEASMRLKDFIGQLPKMFQQMTCEEKREAYRMLIDRIDMYPEETSDGRMIKSISFKFPVFYGNQEPRKDLSPDDTVTYTLDTSELGVTAAEAKATYVQLKSYILEKYGIKVSTLYIAQTKRKYGIDMGKNYNMPADAKTRVPKCPKAKEKMIVDALKHFRMLDEDVTIME